VLGLFGGWIFTNTAFYLAFLMNVGYINRPAHFLAIDLA
jgi:hypothetical protein